MALPDVLNRIVGLANEVSSRTKSNVINPYNKLMDTVSNKAVSPYMKDSFSGLLGNVLEPIIIKSIYDNPKAWEKFTGKKDILSNYKPAYIKEDTKAQMRNIGQTGIRSALQAKGIASPLYTGLVGGLSTLASGAFSGRKDWLKAGLEDTLNRSGRLQQHAGLYSITNPVSESIMAGVGIKGLANTAGVGLTNIGESALLARLNDEKYKVDSPQGFLDVATPFAFKGASKALGKAAEASGITDSIGKVIAKVFPNKMPADVSELMEGMKLERQTMVDQLSAKPDVWKSMELESGIKAIDDTLFALQKDPTLLGKVTGETPVDWLSTGKVAQPETPKGYFSKLLEPVQNEQGGIQPGARIGLKNQADDVYQDLFVLKQSRDNVTQQLQDPNIGLTVKRQLTQELENIDDAIKEITPKVSEFQKILGDESGGIRLGSKVSFGKAAQEEAAQKVATEQAGVKLQPEDLGQRTTPYPNTPKNIAKALLDPDSMQPKVRYRLPNNMSPEDSKIVTDLLDNLPKLKSMRTQMETSWKPEKAARFEQVREALRADTSPEGVQAAIAKLGGEYQKDYADYEAIKTILPKEKTAQIMDLYVRRTNYMADMNDLAGLKGLQKLFGAQEGMPTQNELAKMRQHLGDDFVEQMLDLRPSLLRNMQWVADAVSIPRQLMASYDLSFPLRQGLYFGASHPKAWLKSFYQMHRTAFSPDNYKSLEAKMMADPDYNFAKDMGLKLSELGTGLDKTAREEVASASVAAEKLPIIGAGVRASNRGYTTFANQMRFNLFKTAKAGVDAQFQKDKLIRQGLEEHISSLNPVKDVSEIAKTKAAIAKLEYPDEAAYHHVMERFADFINNGTGSAKLPVSLEKFAVELNQAFFAPKLAWSRVNLLNPAYYFRMPAPVRKEILKSDVLFAGSILTMVGMLKATFGDKIKIGTNPTSANFLKGKIGNTRVDITGGFGQYIRLMSQILSQTYTNSATGEVKKLGEGYNAMTTKDLVQRFVENKYAPPLAFLNELMQLRSEDKNSEYITKNLILNKFIPLFTQDIEDIMKEHDPATGNLLMLLNFYGMGSMTYGDTKKEEGSMPDAWNRGGASGEPTILDLLRGRTTNNGDMWETGKTKDLWKESSGGSSW